MATFTEHYDLLKPDPDDYYDVADFNENMDAIDLQMDALDTQITGVGDKIDDMGARVGEIKALIGNPAGPAENTLFGDLRGAYRDSTTNLQKSAPATLVLPSGSAPKNVSCYLMTFFPRYDGTVRFSVSFRSSTTFNQPYPAYSLEIAARETSVSFVEPPTGSSVPGINPSTQLASYKAHHTFSAPPSTSYTFTLPVNKGRTVVFYTSFKECTYFQIDKAELSYDVIMN